MSGNTPGIGTKNAWSKGKPNIAPKRTKISNGNLQYINKRTAWEAPSGFYEYIKEYITTPPMYNILPRSRFRFGLRVYYNSTPFKAHEIYLHISNTVKKCVNLILSEKGYIDIAFSNNESLNETASNGILFENQSLPISRTRHRDDESLIVYIKNLSTVICKNTIKEQVQEGLKSYLPVRELIFDENPGITQFLGDTLVAVLDVSKGQKIPIFPARAWLPGDPSTYMHIRVEGASTKTSPNPSVLFNYVQNNDTQDHQAAANDNEIIGSNPANQSPEFYSPGANMDDDIITPKEKSTDNSFSPLDSVYEPETTSELNYEPLNTFNKLVCETMEPGTEDLVQHHQTTITYGPQPPKFSQNVDIYSFDNLSLETKNIIANQRNLVLFSKDKIDEAFKGLKSHIDRGKSHKPTITKYNNIAYKAASEMQESFNEYQKLIRSFGKVPTRADPEIFQIVEEYQDLIQDVGLS